MTYPSPPPPPPPQPLQFVDRNVPLDAATPWEQRVVVAVVLHDTEGFGVPFPQRGASWQWLIGRDGTLYRDVSEAYCAHHVRAADRWRPPWLRPIPAAVGVSDVNGCTIGVELVSHQTDRDAGEPYTAAQYATLRALCAALNGTYGDLPYVGHGELQADRSDPVALDWSRAGFGPRTAAGRYLLPAQEDDVSRTTDENARLAQELDARTAERDQLNGVVAELGRQLAYKDELLQAANSRVGALEHDLVAPLQQQVDQLSRALDLAAHRNAREVLVTYDDGNAQRFAPTHGSEKGTGG